MLFLQGGATQLFSTIPMNFLSGPADYVVGGEWSKKAADAAKGAYGDKIRVIASSEATHFESSAPFTADPAASYLHVCSNETVHGHRLAEWPTHPNLVVDSSSEMMSRPHPIARTALVYAGAQKNLGLAGTVLAIVRKDLYDRIPKSVPKLWNFKVAGRGEELPQHPTHLRGVRAARDLPLDGDVRGAWRPSRSATPRRPS